MHRYNCRAGSLQQAHHLFNIDLVIILAQPNLDGQRQRRLEGDAVDLHNGLAAQWVDLHNGLTCTMG